MREQTIDHDAQTYHCSTNGFEFGDFGWVYFGEVRGCLLDVIDAVEETNKPVEDQKDDLEERPSGSLVRQD